MMYGEQMIFMAMYTEKKVKGFGGVLQTNSSNDRDEFEGFKRPYL